MPPLPMDIEAGEKNQTPLPQQGFEGPWTRCLKRVHVVTASPLVLALLRRTFITLTPYVLMVGSARLVTSERFLYLEYARSNFPPDRYGLDLKARQQYGVYCIRYMTNNEDIGYLQSLTLPPELCVKKSSAVKEEETSTTGGCHMLKDKELSHMKDVKVVASRLFTLFWFLAFLQLKIACFLYFTDPSELRTSLLYGSLLSLGIILAILFFSFVAFQRAFTRFHKLFFQDGTWNFNPRDTLIRLYPLRFWIDATVTVGIFTILGAMLMLFCARRKQKKDERVSMKCQKSRGDLGVAFIGFSGCCCTSVDRYGSWMHYW